MTSLLSSPGMIAATAAVFLIEAASLVALVVGLLCYRHIVKSHREFLLSLHQSEKEASRESVGFLFWLYLLLTLIIVLLTAGVYIFHPSLF
ncbi:hypothetical protein HZA45_03660 [Candidatus Peregrinibacteria bacterium]|nr:hypothetical protein [Candidatus Peregrinibacteria bacterium]